MKRTCLECGDSLHGRSDKKFCSDACRNAHHNKLKCTSGNHCIRRINGILARNRNIMEALNPDGKTSIHANRLLKKGFDFGYYTHQYITRAGTAYYFCYDQGYLPLDNGFYMLVSRKSKD